MAREDFIGEVLNHKGEKIFISYDVFRRFKKYRVVDGSGEVLKAIVWNKPRRMYQLTKVACSLMDLWRHSPEFKPVSTARAINPARCGEGGRSRDSGRANRILTTLGSDLSGLPAPSEDSIRRLRGKQKEAKIIRRPLQID